MLLQCGKRKKEKGKTAKRKATGLRDGSGIGPASASSQTYHAMRMQPRIRAFAFQPRVFMRSGRVWWEKTKNMAS